MDSSGKIRVYIRKRPLTRKEKRQKEIDIVDCIDDSDLIVKELRQKLDLTKYIEEHHFRFDGAFHEGIDNIQLYSSAIVPLVQTALEGGKICCFAYGQTGSGKTFTMLGDGSSGLISLAAKDSYANISSDVDVCVSFYEIYCGKLYDLLNGRGLVHAREDGRNNVCITGLSERICSDQRSLEDYLQEGLNVRTTGQTGANADSSRSHAVFTVTFKRHGAECGKMSFIDLAGSERGADTRAGSRQTRMDGAEINKSLLALKECIRALDRDQRHTPFRGSKLTQVLKESLVGNSKTVMIANISPASGCAEHTLNTLRYADRLRDLRRDDDLRSPQPRGLSDQLMLPRQNNNRVRKALFTEDETSPAPELRGRQKASKGSFVQQTRMRMPKSGSESRGSNLIYKGSRKPAPSSTVKERSRSRSPSALDSARRLIVKLDPKDHGGLLRGADPRFENPAMIEDFSSPSNIESNGTNKATFTSNFFTTNKDMINNNNNKKHHQNSSGKIRKISTLPIQYSDHLQKLSPRRSDASSNDIADVGTDSETQGVTFPAGNKKKMMLDRPTPSQAWTEKSEKSTNHSSSPSKTAVPKTEVELKKLSEEHEKLIGIILAEEEDLIQSHRQHIDDMVDLTKQEMVLLHDVDKPGSDIDEYVSNLNAILSHKMEVIAVLQKRLVTFHDHLKEEEHLNKTFQDKQTTILTHNTLSAND
eukprot:CAMPEP_0115008372 /NCGR_PEP_ID=MMETSP0216-20121206/21878_1 /TAXON_ID=223996 /ORGANISM="Protocruzia adherens, Strain Boccale" /LENGTH=702 /DNA_ID=CAMNT_0002375777 /DNA_START=452 /DNA_END=2560 /DNA_ORIENTATION=+